MNALNTLNGIARSKTIWIAVLIAGIGVLEDNMQVLRPLLGDSEFTYFSIAVAIIMAMLRASTTDSLAHKGDDNRQNRESDKQE